jgi:putative component of membrane protein insertase Oxa1/YidC/SpoIIIJ protein YidD
MSKIIRFLFVINLITITEVNANSVIEHIDYFSNVNNELSLNDTLVKKESSVNDYINFYQKYISNIRGHECPMYPSCSNFGIKMFSEKKFVSAFINTSDRLLRCGHDYKNYSLAIISEKFKYLDLIELDSTDSKLLYKTNNYYFAYADSSAQDSNFQIIIELINNQFYQLAFLEILKLEKKQNSFSIDLFANKLICLFAMGEYEKVLFEYDNKCPDNYKFNDELVYQISLAHYKLGNFDFAISNFLNITSLDTNFIISPRQKLLNGLMYANLYKWEDAKSIYKELSTEFPQNKVFNLNYETINNFRILKEKKPALSGIISIIPGAGYFYTGHKQTAVSAFIINSLLSYATYTNIKSQNYGMAVLTGLFNLSFYIGNIQGSIKSAKRFNLQKKKSLINKLEFNSNFQN